MEMQGPGRWELGNRGFHVGSFCLRHLLETHLEVASGWDIQRRIPGGRWRRHHQRGKEYESPRNTCGGPSCIWGFGYLISDPG